MRGWQLCFTEVGDKKASPSKLVNLVLVSLLCPTFCHNCPQSQRLFNFCWESSFLPSWRAYCLH